MTKYQEYVRKMMEAEKEAFDKFKTVHDRYALDDSIQEEYNREGEIIQKVIHEWEGKLCSQSEKGGYGVFTGNLAEKFHTELLKVFPYLDHIGIIVKPFSLKKIKL
jgi:hypothetical protein